MEQESISFNTSKNSMQCAMNTKLEQITPNFVMFYMDSTVILRKEIEDHKGMML